jgi:hypothetical protein
MTTITLSNSTPNLLRRALLADAAVSGATGALMAVAAVPLSGLLGLPAALLFWAGAALLPFAAFLVWLGRSAGVPRTAAWSVVACNVLWAAGSVALLASGWVAPTALGYAFTVFQAVAVAVFAELQYFGIRRSTR